MGIPKPVLEGLNGLMNMDLEAAHLYLAMAGWCEVNGLPGFAKWLREQSGEEREHAMRVFRHLCDRGVQPSLGGLEAPAGRYRSVLEMFEQVLAKEEAVTAKVDALFAQARKSGDFAAEPLLQWFVAEQIQEERQARTILEWIRAAGDRRDALLMLDRQVPSLRQED
jgi:ferritin